MEVRSLGYRTDLMIRALEGSQLADRGDYLVVRTPQNPSYWWGNFLLLSDPPQPGEAGQQVTDAAGLVSDPGNCAERVLCASRCCPSR